MTVQRQIGFWIAALVITVLLLFVLRGILLPFVAGFALAYLLDPLADRMQKIGIGRLGASLLILILFVLVFIIALMILVPFAAQQVGAFVERLPGYVSRLQELGAEQLGPLIRRLGIEEVLPAAPPSVGNLISQGIAWMTTFLQGLWSGGQALIPVGSKAIRASILEYGPVLSMHGHIHEGRGAVKLGRTLAVNPGSTYEDGVLQAAIVDLDLRKAEVKRYLLING